MRLFVLLASKISNAGHFTTRPKRVSGLDPPCKYRNSRVVAAPLPPGRAALPASSGCCWLLAAGAGRFLVELSSARQDLVAEAGASRKSVGSWELFFVI
jgi:hypothetical protein